HALVELPFTQLGAQLFPGALGLLALGGQFAFWSTFGKWGRRRKQKVEDAFFGGFLGAIGDFIEFFLADHVDGSFDKVPDHGFDVAPDVADFGVLGGFDFYERATGQAGQAAGNFRFADASG